MENHRCIADEKIAGFQVRTTRPEGGVQVDVLWRGRDGRDEPVVVQWSFTPLRGTDGDPEALAVHAATFDSIAADPLRWEMRGMQKRLSLANKAVENAERGLWDATKKVETEERAIDRLVEETRREEWRLARAEERVARSRRGPLVADWERLAQNGIDREALERWRPGERWLAEVTDNLDGLPPRWASSRVGDGRVVRIVVAPSALEGSCHGTVDGDWNGSLYLAIPAEASPAEVARHVEWAREEIHQEHVATLKQTQGEKWVAENMPDGDFRPTAVFIAGPARYVEAMDAALEKTVERLGLTEAHSIPRDRGHGEPSWEREVFAKAGLRERGRGVER